MRPPLPSEGRAGIEGEPAIVAAGDDTTALRDDGKASSRSSRTDAAAPRFRRPPCLHGLPHRRRRPSVEEPQAIPHFATAKWSEASFYVGASPLNDSVARRS